jgi:hypothetical protein
VPYSALADAFGVHNETVAKICRVDNKYYKKVKEISRRMGMAQMYEHYWMEELQNKVDATLQDRIAKGLIKGQRLYIDTGSGTYYLYDSKDRVIPVDILHSDDIRREEPEASLTAGEGVYVKDPEFGWSVFRDQPFRNVAEALRYLAAYPSTLDDFAA